MKKLYSYAYLLMVLILTTFLIGCAKNEPQKENDSNNNITNNENINSNNEVLEGLITDPFDVNTGSVDLETIDKTHILVKTNMSENEIVSKVNKMGVVNVKRMLTGSNWFILELDDQTNIVNLVKNLRELNYFDLVDYDYLVKSSAIDVSREEVQNPYMDFVGVKDTWNYLNDKGLAGGSSDVVVAVIDTGVDFNHKDLVANIWTNTAEIPGNGVDDDKNGFIDDYHGYDCVGNNGDPMDNNGHGTHVAGIIAASNDGAGMTGIAYNTKIMPIKAGNSSGVFLNSDIAEAITYAYMNGADVINMSFGGSAVSLPVQEALENAYTTSVLVASAGNDSMANERTSEIKKATPNYPAAYQFVIGVMSCSNTGVESEFTNYDTKPNNKVEYEVYAPGEQIYSTMPGGKYAYMSGTSMSAPVVSGIAALLRANYTDTNTYPSKFVFSQIVNSNTVLPTLIHPTDSAKKHANVATIANAYQSMTKLPTPNVSLYDYYFFDNKELSNRNNGNGIIEAGETIRVGLELKNKGGVAGNVNIRIDASGSHGVADKYFTFTKDNTNFSDIGTYSVRDGNKIYDENKKLIGVENYLEFKVDDTCPNDYIMKLNLEISYTNGLNNEDHNTYKNTDSKLEFTVVSGEFLPSIVKENTTFPGNKRYILVEDMTIPKGVTVTFEAGATIQYYADENSGEASVKYSPKIYNYGNLYFNGTKDNMISFGPSESHSVFACNVTNFNSNIDSLTFNYCNIMNLAYYNKSNSYPFKVNSSVVNYTTVVSSSKSRVIVEYVGGYTKSAIHFNQMHFNNSYVNLSFGADVSYGGSFSNVFNNSFINYNATGEIEHTRYLTSSSNNVFIIEPHEDEKFAKISLKGQNDNNLFIHIHNSKDIKSYPRIVLDDNFTGKGNKFHGLYQSRPGQLIENLYDSDGNLRLDVNDTTGQDLSKVYPFITDVKFLNKDGLEQDTFGIEDIKVRIEFNRPMNTTIPLDVRCGSTEPYADYVFKGNYTSSTIWEGTTKLTSFIENGMLRLNVDNAVSADEQELKLYDKGYRFTFNIDKSSAQSMNLNGHSTNDGVVLEWKQDDYSTLMGYNIYRSEEKDGNYAKINPYLIPSNENTFIDKEAMPGKTYWYSFTVVLSDFSESPSSGRTAVTTLDTLPPNIYHTPVNQAYLGSNLIIKCSATDNVSVTEAKLYYRTKGTLDYKFVLMSKNNDSYIGKINGSELSLEGLEYYIEVFDGTNKVNKGSSEVPYEVVVKEDAALMLKGDVDGDGIISTKDALMIMKHIEGKLILKDDEFKRADLNDDKKLNASEALKILQYINGKIPSLK